MKYDIKDITSGKYIGNEFYIAEVNTKVKNHRIITPQLALLCDANDAKKTIYYSSTFFKIYDKKGKLKKDEIAIFDNTGYRSLSGNPISVFSDYESAKSWFNTQINELIKTTMQQKESSIKYYDNYLEVLRGKLT